VFSPLAEAAGYGYGPAVFALVTGISAMVLAALWIVGLVRQKLAGGGCVCLHEREPGVGDCDTV